MPGKFGFGGTALAVALAAGVVAGAGIASQPAFAQNKKDQGNSPAFVAAAQPLIDKVKVAMTLQPQASKGDAAAKAQLDAALVGVPAMVAQAEAVAKTPRDKLTIGQLALQVGVLTNDTALAQRGARTMLASKQLDPATTTQVQQTLQQLSAAPARDTVLEQVNAHVSANNAPAALAELRRALTARAGQRAPSAWYQRAIQIADTSNNGAEALDWSARWAEAYPSNLSWLSAAQVIKKYGSQEPHDKLDVLRLMARSGALSNEPRFVAREYAEYADMANLRGYYNEVVKVVDQGRAAGALTASQGAHLRASANSKVAADRTSLASQESRGRAAADGIPALAAADLYLSFDNPAKAEEMYKIALQKGRVDRDRALTRLGIAQFDQGKYAEARATFAQVAGQRKAQARLWLALVNQKTSGAA